MTRAIHKLTNRQVETIKKAGRYSDGGGLYLRVTNNSAKRWVFRFTPPGGTSREIGLGSAGKQSVGLARARELAQKARDAVLDGKDPVKAKPNLPVASPEAPLSFGVFADEYVAIQAKSFRNTKHIAQWKMTLTKYAKPIRRKGLDEITTDDVLQIIRPMWQTKAETASRLRGRIEKVLDAAKAKGLRSGENPARWRGHLELLLPKRQRLQRGHHKALEYKQLPEFIHRLQNKNGMAALALEFLILSAARSGEVRNMTWAELSLDDLIWTIPADRMKAGREHRVPITNRMMVILETVSPWSSSGKYVFPNRSTDKPLTDTAVSKTVKGLDQNGSTVHGFRSTFRDWVGDETEYPRELAETALAHVIGNATERAYRRGDAFEKRRVLMANWEIYCLKTAKNRDTSCLSQTANIF